MWIGIEMKIYIIVEVLCTLAYIKVALAFAGATKFIDTLKTRTSKCPRSPREWQFEMARIKAAYSIAVRIFPRRVECLTRSLTLYVLARKRRIPVQFHIGVRKFPFTSHAWIELNGPVFPEDIKLISGLTPIIRLD